MTSRLKVDNCPRCGAIYDKNLRNLCPACMKEMDDMLNLCESFMWKHENASTNELHEATGVPMDVILKFMKEHQKLQTKYYPNLTYPCEKCGTGIREARICVKCASLFHEVFKPVKPRNPIPQIGGGFRLRDRFDRK